MSLENEIKALRKQRIEEGTKTRKLTDTVTVDVDLAPFKEDTSGLFKAGTLDDGMDLRTAIALGGTATIGDISASIVQGAGGLVEGAVDLGAYGVANILEGFGKYGAAYDVKKFAEQDTVGGLMSDLREKSGIKDYSFLGDFGYDVGSGVGYITGLAAGGALAKAAGVTGKGLSVVSNIIMGLSGMGSGMSEAYSNGATDGEAAAYGAMSAGAEILSEMMFGGLGQAFQKLGVGTGLIDLDDVITKKLTKNITNNAVKNLLQLGIKASGEGIEEVVSGFLSSLAKKTTYKSEEDYGKILADEDLLKQAFSGFLVSLISQSGDVMNSTNQGREYITGLTDNEQKVVDKVYENRVAEAEKDGKLTSKEKNKIYEEVLEDLDNGGIDIDLIEEVLGGETYKSYKNTIDSEDALKKEYEDLGKKTNPTLAEQTRYNELHEQMKDLEKNSKRNELKSQLGNEVYSLAKDGKLAESYNERARRGEKFTADVTKYKGKQAEIVKKAMDSGILNNTRRTHEMVDLIAKVSADKGVNFDFTNNEKLKESGFAVGGRFVNGYVTKDGITVNINSKKALNSVVGHEITHVLEGTELYSELQKAVYDYANAKGDYANRRADIEKLYKDIKDSDVDAELTADLVGDYLFTDTDFVRSLSTGNRNLFEKLFDEIKYLCKIATAGSKEARQLEKVKKAFQEAYRESSKSARDDANSLKQTEGNTTEQPTEVNLSEKLSPEDAQAMNIMASNIVKAAETTGLFLDDYYKATENINAFNPTRADANTIADALAEYVEVMDKDIYREYLEKIREFGGTQYSLSSMANTFFDDPDMSAYEFQQADYKQTQGYKDYVEECLNNYRQTRADFDETAVRKEIEDSIDGIVEVAIAAKKAGYDIYDDPGKRDKRDSKKRLLFSSLEPNSEYTTSNDISTICDKRQNFADIYDDIVRREEAMGVPKGKRFFDNVDNYFAIHKIMADKGLTQPCRQCYVESMRKNLAPMANAFLKLVQETNPDNKANDQLYHAKGKQKGELKTSNASTRDFVLNALELHPEYNLTVGDLDVETLTTADGLAQLKIQAPLVYEAFNSFYGQSKPKMPKAATPFRFGELTALLTDDKGKIKQSLVDKINATGGFRLQSYSDFQIQNYTDVLQVLFEAGTLGLKGHAYTKVPAFLEATEGTNLKRNISIFMYKDGNEWKIDRNDSFPYSLEEIYDIVNADKSGNTSIIAVSQNAEMSAWIMANDNVGYGIPFHKSGMKMGTVRDTIVKEDGREIKGYSGIKDHTKQQTEVWAKTTADHKAETKVKKGINIYEFWDFENADGLSKNELIEKNVKRYIAECEIRGYLPKFREYVMNNDKVLKDTLNYAKELGFASPDATIDDISFTYKGYRIPYGYYKFLGDFGMFTPDGQVSTPKTLSLENYDFDKAVKFFEDAETLRRNEILQQFSNGEERQKYRESNLSAEELDKIVKQKRGEVVDEVVNRKNSLSFEHEAPTRIKGGIYGEDVALKAPVAENVAPTSENIAPIKETVNEAPIAPIRNDAVTENAEIIPNGTKVKVSDRDNVGTVQSYNEATKEYTVFFRGKNGTATKTFPASMVSSLNPTPSADQATSFTKSKIGTSEGVKKKPKSTLEWLRRNFIDKLGVFEDIALKTNNRALMDKAHTMLLSRQKAQYMIENGDADKGVKALADIREAVKKDGHYDDFVDYIFNKHNIDRMSIESNAMDSVSHLEPKFGHLGKDQIVAIANTEITPKTTPKTAQTINEAKEYLSALNKKNKAVFDDTVTADVSRDVVKKYEQQYPQFTKFAEDVYNYNRNLLNMLVEEDILTQEAADLWMDRYPYYVPVVRTDYEGKPVVSLDKKGVGVNAPIKKAVGGNSEIQDVFKSIADRTEMTIKAIDKNRFGKELKKTINANVVENTNRTNDVDDILNSPDKILTPGLDGNSATFGIYENGKRVDFEITEDMYNALKPTSGDLARSIPVVSTLSKARRAILTSLSPMFAIKNPIRDIQDVFMNSKHAAQTYKNMLRAIKELAKNEGYAVEYAKNGGISGEAYDSETKAFKEAREGIMKYVGVPVDKLKGAGEFVETVPRLAEYIASRENGETIEGAMLDAARVTTNFVAGGDVTKFLNRNGFTFLNASVQGAAQQVRNVREAKQKGIKGVLTLGAKAVLAGLPLALANALIWDDDEEYEELPDYVKDNYYIVGKYGDQFVRIPKGRTLAVIQKAFDSMGDVITGNDEVDYDTFGELLWNNFVDTFQLGVSNLAPNNPLDNNIIAPIIQAHTNKAWYGDDIVPERLQDLPAGEQYDENIDLLSKWLGEKTNLSPYRLNYLLDQYTGAFGDFVLPMITPKAESDVGVLAPFKNEFVVDSTIKNKNATNFFNKADELKVKANSAKATDSDILKSKYMDAVNAQLSDLYKKKRNVQNSTLSDKQKYAAVKELQQQINDLCEMGLESYKDVTIDGVYATVADMQFRYTDSGKWSRIDDEQLEKQKTETARLGITPADYWRNYTLSNVVGENYKTYSSEIKNITSDKNANGDTVKDSRKKKVVAYINGLGVDYGEKLLIYKAEYPADDSYNYEIVDYLNSRDDLTTNDIRAILGRLGFEIDSEGNISWD